MSNNEPMETKLFGGIVYSVVVDTDEPRVTVYVGEGAAAIIEVVDCAGILSGDRAGLFSLGHVFAEKFILSGDARLN